MAFYNRKMSRNKSLTKAWRAAHLGNLDDDKEICLPEICDEIARWTRRDRHPRSRLSLRSFSALLSGATRLYNRQLGDLLKDTFECSISTSVTPRPVQSTLGKEKLISECSEEESSELMPEIEETDIHREDTKSSTNDFDAMSDEPTVFTVIPNSDQQPNISAQASGEKRDQEIQTSSIPVPDYNGVFDTNLPFGYLMVHDSYHSRIPTKIMFSSLSEKIKYLPIRK